MLHQINEMSKMTFKILLRNKFFLFFSVVLVTLCTCILNISSLNDTAEKENDIMVLENLKTPMAYLEDFEKYQIRVYNSCDDVISQTFLEELNHAGNFQIFECKSGDYDSETVMSAAKYMAKHDKIDVIMILNKDFSEQINKGSVTDSMMVFRTGEDERYDMFEQYAKATLEEMIQNAKEGNETLSSLDSKKTISVEQIVTDENKSLLDMDVDYTKTSVLGNVIAFYTVAFLFSGIMIAGTILAERDNRVITRIFLTNASNYSYMLSKFIVIIASSLFQTIIGTIALIALVKIDIGLSIPQFALLLFGLALIFNSLSVCVGICCGNILSACIISFTLWMCCSLLGGLYFSINNSSITFKRVASLMPSRWALKAASMLMNGNNQGYPLMIMVAVTYVVVILLIGVLGLRLRSNEQN